ncbi:hypothetical protein CEXT_775121 [Caerostris extrusa]|uniref:Frizzled/Smoothened 7TM domain-containing protein n=1 Tax=Caerostris extrusa TaxID=172846 RepID=A0AAV4N7D0_CAEEX|nr:hypothetical protein CEXT_775121 [Caerostris extrusa]
MVPLVDAADRKLYHDVATGGVPQCARPCRERPIIFLSGCYLMVSIGYLVRLVLATRQWLAMGKSFATTQ